MTPDENDLFFQSADDIPVGWEPLLATDERDEAIRECLLLLRAGKSCGILAESGRYLLWHHLPGYWPDTGLRYPRAVPCLPPQ